MQTQMAAAMDALAKTEVHTAVSIVALTLFMLSDSS